MIIKIGDTSLKYTETINVEQFQTLLMFDFMDNKWNAQICAHLLNTTVKTFTNVNDIELVKLKGILLNPLNKLENAEVKHYINGRKLIDIDNLTLGQFVDLDVLTVEGVENTLSQIVAQLYNMDIEDAMQTNILDVYGALTLWKEFRLNIYKTYDYLFSTSSDASGETTEADTHIKASWYKLIVALANEDFIKIHQVVERPLIEALNYLDWLKAKREQEAREMRKKLNKMKLK